MAHPGWYQVIRDNKGLAIIGMFIGSQVASSLVSFRLSAPLCQLTTVFPFTERIWCI